MFEDFAPQGTLVHLEWETPAAVTLRSFRLLASHDPSPRNIQFRGFSRFSLLAQPSSAGLFELIFEMFPSDPYGATPPPPAASVRTNPSRNRLDLAVNLLPTTASRFRAEFVQAGLPSNASGVRIHEIAGFAAPFTGGPVPGATSDASPS